MAADANVKPNHVPVYRTILITAMWVSAPSACIFLFVRVAVSMDYDPAREFHVFLLVLSYVKYAV